MNERTEAHMKLWIALNEWKDAGGHIEPVVLAIDALIAVHIRRSIPPTAEAKHE